MNRILILIAFLATAEISADDYETATRFNAGDTISADVLNDILDRIELTLKTLDTSELVGSWDVTWKTCINGGPGNCFSLDVGTGWSSSFDNLYKTRTDTWTITADGDGTYTLSISNYCVAGASNGQYYNDPCTLRINVDDGILLYGTETGAGVDETPDSDHTGFFSVKRISTSRIQMWDLKPGSNSFISLQLDKQSIPPKAPKNLSVTRTADKAALSWTAGDSTQTSYNVKRKTTLDGTFTSIGTPTTESYEDTLTKGNIYWYRVFATDSDGTSNGSNVIQIAYINTPPYLNLASTFSVNEGTINVVSIGATDADGDSLTYTIGSQSPSNDATNFSISSAGVISFNSAPDYENPSDYNTDNIYTINVSVSDGIETIDQDLGVVVLDVDE